MHSQEYVHVVMEHGGRDLYDLIGDHSGVNTTAAQTICLCLALALAHCSDRGIIHRDVKPEVRRPRAHAPRSLWYDPAAPSRARKRERECRTLGRWIVHRGRAVRWWALSFFLLLPRPDPRAAPDVPGKNTLHALGGGHAGRARSRGHRRAAAASCRRARQNVLVRTKPDDVGVVESLKLCDFGLCAIASVQPSLAARAAEFEQRGAASSSDGGAGAATAESPSPSTAIATPGEKAAEAAEAGGAAQSSADAAAGCAVERDWMLSDFAGSPGFVAPEILTEPEYDGRYIDAFSLGCVLLEVRSIELLTRASERTNERRTTMLCERERDKHTHERTDER